MANDKDTGTEPQDKPQAAARIEPTTVEAGAMPGRVVGSSNSEMGMNAVDIDPDDENYLWVCSGRSDTRVAFMEKDKRHPIMGEAFVATSAPTAVFLTPKVQEALRMGVIIECDGPRRENQVPVTGPPPEPESRKRGGTKSKGRGRN